MMNRHLLPSLSLLLLFAAFRHGSAFSAGHSRSVARRLALSSIRGGDGGGDALSEATAPGRDYGPEMSALFGNLRIPAALFAGASAGAAFAMPLSQGDGLRVGIVKRVYGVLMVGSLGSQLLAIVVSTLAMGNIATKDHALAPSFGQFVKENYDLEWIACRVNFLFGILGFLTAVGMRAWTTFGCPVFERIALGIALSTVLLAFGFVEETEREIGGSLAELPSKYVRLLVRRAKKDPLFALGFASSFLTWGYMVAKLPHVVKYLYAHSK